MPDHSSDRELLRRTIVNLSPGIRFRIEPRPNNSELTTAAIAAKGETRLKLNHRKTSTLLLCLASAALTSTATPLTTTFTYTGAVHTFTAPSSGLYNIAAFGAQGGGSFEAVFI